MSHFQKFLQVGTRAFNRDFIKMVKHTRFSETNTKTGILEDKSQFMVVVANTTSLNSESYGKLADYVFKFNEGQPEYEHVKEHFSKLIT